MLMLAGQDSTGFWLIIGLGACVALGARMWWQSHKAPPAPSVEFTAEEQAYLDRRPVKTTHRCTCAHTWEKIRDAPKGKEGFRCIDCGGELYSQSALHGYSTGRWCSLAADPPDPYI